MKQSDVQEYDWNEAACAHTPSIRQSIAAVMMGHADIQTAKNRYAYKRINRIEGAKNALKTMYK